MRPNYSIFIPAHRADEHIENFCNNILNQVLKPDQIIIVDDTNNSENFFKKIKKRLKILNKDIQILFIKNKKNLRPPKSWNNNLNLFRNNLIFRMDVDDYWNRDHTIKMIDEYLLDRSYLCYIQKSQVSFFKKIFLNDDFIFINTLIHSSALFNLNIFNFRYSLTKYPFDDLKAFIKIKYFLNYKIKALNFNSCSVKTGHSGRWSDEKIINKEIYLKKLFLVALRKKLKIKRLNFSLLFKLLITYNIFQTIFILLKIIRK